MTHASVDRTARALAAHRASRLASMSPAADTFWPFLDARDDDDYGGAGGGDFGVGSLDGHDALVREEMRVRMRIFCW